MDRRQFVGTSVGVLLPLVAGCTGTSQSASTEQGSDDNGASENTTFKTEPAPPSGVLLDNEMGSEVTVTISIRDAESGAVVRDEEYLLAADSTGDVDEHLLPLDDLREGSHEYVFATDAGEKATQRYSPSEYSQLRCLVHPDRLETKIIS